MIETEEVSQSTSMLKLASPWQYHKCFCQVCWREWIAEPTKEGKRFKPPLRCSYEDCRSYEWNDPEKGAVKRVVWLRKRGEKSAKKTAMEA